VDGARGGPFASRTMAEAARPASVRPAAEAARLARAGRRNAHHVHGHRARGRQRLASGQDAARFVVQAPLLSGEGAGQEKRRRGSPRRSDVSGVVGSGQRGGVPVEGGSSGVAVASWVVLRLEAEARGRYGRCVGVGRKARRRGGGIRPMVGGSPLLKGAAGMQWRGGVRGSRVTHAARVSAQWWAASGH
jgi:hypothetical protein